jgi:hypothetical protein
MDLYNIPDVDTCQVTTAITATPEATTAAILEAVWYNWVGV